MRMSCNGCRVLRKGCSDNCSISPCLKWIKNPDSQANATVFLAKFYGRAGLMNLIKAGPPNLRPAIFRSLLYEACGRIVNPIYGSVGLLWSGSWQLCHNAVEAVLKGAPITRIETDAAETRNGPPYKAYDIRHVNKEDNFSWPNDLHRVRNKCRLKRPGRRSKGARVSVGSVEESSGEEVNASPSHESSLNHQSEEASTGNAEPALDTVREDARQADKGEIELDLTLGFEPFTRYVKPTDLTSKQAVGSTDYDAGFCKMELGLDYSVS